MLPNLVLKVTAIQKLTHFDWILSRNKQERIQTTSELKIFSNPNGTARFENLRKQWKGSNRKQSARWQHIFWLKASAFCIW
jgi:hypothetical protein